MAIPKTTAPPRTPRPDEVGVPKPLYAVWEVTLRCDQPCAHCGSRAGAARSDELSTKQLLEVAEGLVALGCREAVMIGGEAYLRDDLDTLVAYLANVGVRVNLQTGGRRFDLPMARRLKAAGLTAVGVSIDGPEEVHDVLRGNPGSWRCAVGALDAAREAGLAITANTQVNRLNHEQLEPHALDLQRRGVLTWQVMITVAMGRAADRPDWILQPWEIVPLIDTLARIQLDAAERYQDGIPFNVIAGNNLGYYGPHEQILRSLAGGAAQHWGGCGAGMTTIGIESDGTIKGCPSLPTGPYAGGNVRESSLQQIWRDAAEVRFTRDRTEAELWGFCADCYYADICRGGCSWTSHCTLGRRGNNPFCYHRVKQLEKRGVRERLVHREAPPREPYDFGRFELVEEPLDADPPPVPRRGLPVLG